MADDEGKKESKNKVRRNVGIAAVVVLVGWLVLKNGPVMHEDVPVTTYAIGVEDSGKARTASAWDPKWQSHFGGVDTPGKRQNQDNWPAGFKPKENPFYVALPYDELASNGTVKKSATQLPWYDAKRPPTKTYSTLKNRWIMVKFDVRTVYVQWEDVGPGGADDASYVIDGKPPKHKAAGIGLSPAAMQYLAAKDGDAVGWRFVDADEVPAGPWKTIVTNRQVTR